MAKKETKQCVYKFSQLHVATVSLVFSVPVFIVLLSVLSPLLITVTFYTVAPMLMM